MEKKMWIKPELKDFIKPIETVFIWNSGQPDKKPWENPVSQRTVFLTRIKELFSNKKVTA